MLSKLLPTTLKGYIVHELLQRGKITSAELIKESKGRWGRAAVYKELQAISHSGIALKIGNSYSLKRSSIEELCSLASRAEQQHAGYFQRNVIPRAQKITRFKFDTLSELDFFLLELFTTLVTQVQPKEYYEWLPLPWGNLIHELEWRTYREYLETRNTQARSLLAYQAPVSKMIANRIQKDGHKISFKSWEEAPSDREYITVIGPYIVTVTLDEACTAKIQQALSLKSQELGRVYQLFFALLSTKIRAVVTIKHNTKAALAITQSIKKYF